MNGSVVQQQRSDSFTLTLLSVETVAVQLEFQISSLDPLTIEKEFTQSGGTGAGTLDFQLAYSDLNLVKWPNDSERVNTNYEWPASDIFVE